MWYLDGQYQREDHISEDEGGLDSVIKLSHRDTHTVSSLAFKLQLSLLHVCSPSGDEINQNEDTASRHAWGKFENDIKGLSAACKALNATAGDAEASTCKKKKQKKIQWGKTTKWKYNKRSRDAPITVFSYLWKCTENYDIHYPIQSTLFVLHIET